MMPGHEQSAGKAIGNLARFPQTQFGKRLGSRLLVPALVLGAAIWMYREPARHSQPKGMIGLELPATGGEIAGEVFLSPSGDLVRHSDFDRLGYHLPLDLGRYQDSRAGNQDVYVSLIPSTPVAVHDPGAPLALLQAAPNPFRTSTRLVRVGSRGSASGELRVFDGSGREVRRLTAETSGDWRWDGRDDQGRELPAGAYYLRTAETSARSTRVVRLR